MSRLGFDCIADTSAVIVGLRDPELSPLREAEYALAFVTVAELLFGVMKSVKPAQTLLECAPIIRGHPVLVPTESTPARYAWLACELEKRGQKIPVNDLWIATLAIQHDVPLLARDAHFERVPGLHLIRV